jgi:hypothetical protein
MTPPAKHLQVSSLINENLIILWVPSPLLTITSYITIEMTYGPLEHDSGYPVQRQ